MTLSPYRKKSGECSAEEANRTFLLLERSVEADRRAAQFSNPVGKAIYRELLLPLFFGVVTLGLAGLVWLLFWLPWRLF